MCDTEEYRQMAREEHYERMRQRGYVMEYGIWRRVHAYDPTCGCETCEGTDND